MGKVNEFEYAIDHRITERDGCVDEAKRDAIDQHLGQKDEGDLHQVHIITGAAKQKGGGDDNKRNDQTAPDDK